MSTHELATTRMSSICRGRWRGRCQGMPIAPSRRRWPRLSERRSRASSPLIVEAGTGTGKDLRLSGAGVAVGAQRDHLYRHAHLAGPAVPPRYSAARQGLGIAGRRSPCSRGEPTICAGIDSNSPPSRALCFRASAASHACSRGCRAGRRPPRQAIYPSSPICRSSRRYGRASPPPVRIVWARSARNSLAAMCSRRGAMPRRPTSSS